MVDQINAYIYQKRGFYYFSRRVPKELHSQCGCKRSVLALNTRSRAKAMKYSQVICQRLDDKWLPMRLEAMGIAPVLTNDDAGWLQLAFTRKETCYPNLVKNNRIFISKKQMRYTCNNEFKHVLRACLIQRLRVINETDDSTSTAAGCRRT